VSRKLSVSKLGLLVVLTCLARMSGMPTDNSNAREISQYDRVKGGRSGQDNAAHLPPDYPNCLPPRKGATRRDPIYGRAIKRLTDSTKPGPGEPQSMTAEYATQNHFNADETAIFVTYSGHDAQGFNKSVVQILDAGSGDLLYDLPIAINNEPMWDCSDPNVLYFHAGNALRKMVLGPEGTSTNSLIHTFVEYTSISSTGESDISPDGKKIIFVGRVRTREKRARERDRDVFVYTLPDRANPEGKKGPVLDIAGSALDKAQITNHFVVLGFNDFRCMGARTSLYDHKMNLLWEMGRYSGHGDAGMDSERNEVYYTSSADAPVDDRNYQHCVNSILKFDLAHGSVTCLETGDPAFDWSLANHIAAPDQPSPWVYVSTHAPCDPDPGRTDPSCQWKPYTNEILRIRSDGSGKIERLAHHHSRPHGRDSYAWQPRVSVNRNGTKVLFNSNYGLHHKRTSCHCKVSEEYTDVYLVIP